MQPGFEARAEYLSLALFAQNIVAELAKLDQHHDVAELRKMLDEAKVSLTDIQSGDIKRFGRRDAVAFNSYQQISALNKAWSDSDRDRATKLISDVLANLHDQKAANELADLFTKLQVQALWSFDQPERPPVEGLRKLCQLTP